MEIGDTISFDEPFVFPLANRCISRRLSLRTREQPVQSDSPAVGPETRRSRVLPKLVARTQNRRPERHARRIRNGSPRRFACINVWDGAMSIVRPLWRRSGRYVNRRAYYYYYYYERLEGFRGAPDGPWARGTVTTDTETGNCYYFVTYERAKR